MFSEFIPAFPVVRKAVNNAQDTGEWWLRTMGEYTDNAVVVSENATVCKDGKRVVENFVFLNVSFY